MSAQCGFLTPDLITSVLRRLCVVVSVRYVFLASMFIQCLKSFADKDKNKEIKPCSVSNLLVCSNRAFLVIFGPGPDVFGLGPGVFEGS